MSLLRNVNIDAFNGAIINKFMHRHTGTTTTLTVATTGGGTEYQISVADATGFAVGDYLHINTTSIETTHPKIISISSPTGASVFTLDRRIDMVHNIGDTVDASVLDVSSIAGTLASPQIYTASPTAGETWYISRLLFEMTHTAAGDLGYFGGITELTNGVILRAKISGNYYTFSNWKSNADIKADMFDVEFDNRATSKGLYGTSGRGTFKAADTVMVLNGNNGDMFELYVQDDITALNRFTVKIQGHKI